MFALLVAGGAAFAWWADSEAGKRRAAALRQQIEDETREREDRDRVVKNGGALSSWVEQCEVALKGDRADLAETAQMEIDRRMPGGGADDLRPRIDRCVPTSPPGLRGRRIRKRGPRFGRH